MTVTPSPDVDRPWCMIGSGGHARAVADVIERAGGSLGCVVDPEGAWGSDDALRVTSETEGLDWASALDAPVVVAVGDNVNRVRIVDTAVQRGLRLPAVVADTASVSRRAALSAGVVVMEHAHVGPRAALGRAVLVNTSAVIEHDCVVGPGAHVAPGSVMLGGTALGAHVLLGARAVLLIGHTVHDGARVAAGAVVVCDVEAGQTVIGTPARARSVPAQ